MVAVEKAVHGEQENFSDISAVLGKSRHQILAAQFECYLKIIHDPPHTEEGDKIVPIVQFIHSSIDNSRSTGSDDSLKLRPCSVSGRWQINVNHNFLLLSFSA